MECRFEVELDHPKVRASQPYRGYKETTLMSPNRAHSPSLRIKRPNGREGMSAAMLDHHLLYKVNSSNSFSVRRGTALELERMFWTLALELIL